MAQDMPGRALNVPVMASEKKSRRIVFFYATAFLFLLAGFSMAVVFQSALAGPTLGRVFSVAALVILYGALFSLAAFLTVAPYEQALIAFAAVVGLVILFPPIVAVAVLIVAVLALWGVVRAITTERGRNLILSVSRAAAVGRSLFVLCLALILSGGYFVSVKDLSWESITERLSIGKQTTALALGAIARIRPEWGSLASPEATVDDFLTAQWNERIGGSVTELPSDIKDRIDELERQGIAVRLNDSFLADADASARGMFLASGRAELEKLVGYPLTGAEPMTTVLSEGIERRVLTIFQSSEFRERVPEKALPITLALLFFLTVSPLLALSAFLWEMVASLLFALLRETGALTVHTRVVEQEFLAD